MSSQAWCLALASLPLLVACGDSSSSGAGGSTGTASTSSTGTGSSSTGMVCSKSTTRADCQTCCSTQNPAGSKKLLDKVTVACGCMPNASCSTQCMGEAFCTDATSMVSAGCDTCVRALGATSTCAASVAPACSADNQCEAALSCVVGCVSLP